MKLLKTNQDKFEFLFWVIGLIHGGVKWYDYPEWYHRMVTFYTPSNSSVYIGALVMRL
jgi:hypothetical protein